MLTQEGYSGADIAEIVNKATRYAIKDTLKEFLRREKLKEEAIEKGEDDSIYTVKQEYFTLALQNSRKSVSEADLARYRHYAEVMAQSRGIVANEIAPNMPQPAGPSFSNPNPNAETDMFDN